MKATEKMLRTLWSSSQATTLFIREEIHASVMEVFNYFVLEHSYILKMKKSAAHCLHVVHLFMNTDSC